MILSFYKNEDYFVFVKLKSLKAQDTFSEAQFYFYPLMVISATLECT